MLASCCSVLVVYGTGAWRDVSRLSMPSTVNERRGRGGMAVGVDAQRLGDGAGLGLGAELELVDVGGRRLAALADQARRERRLLLLEDGVDRPRLLGDEGVDLRLAVDHQAHGHGLHPPRRQPGAHLAPEQRAELVADQAVDHPARLLGGDQPAVDLARLGERGLDRALGDLVEDHAVGVVELERLGDVPGDRLALAVGVGGEQRAVGLLARRPAAP